MDAALDAAELAAALGALLEEKDFDGAEVLLTNALFAAPATSRAFLHVQFARLYRDWNKLTSAIDHLHRAIEIEGLDPFLKLQILEDLKQTRARQGLQRP